MPRHVRFTVGKTVLRKRAISQTLSDPIKSIEPPREFRRLVVVSHAAMADSVSRR